MEFHRCKGFHPIGEYGSLVLQRQETREEKHKYARVASFRFTEEAEVQFESKARLLPKYPLWPLSQALSTQEQRDRNTASTPPLCRNPTFCHFLRTVAFAALSLR